MPIAPPVTNAHASVRPSNSSLIVNTECTPRSIPTPLPALTLSCPLCRERVPRECKNAPVKWGEYGRRPLVVLSLVALIDAVDRGILPGVLDNVQDDFGFNDSRAGLIGTAYVLAGFLVVMPAGYLADRGKRTHIIALVLLSWGFISALNALAQNLVQFIAIRSALGIGETIDNPASQSYWPTTTRPSGVAARTPRNAPRPWSARDRSRHRWCGERRAQLALGVPHRRCARFVDRFSLLATARTSAPRQRKNDARLARRP
jgi:hypothetical protein